MKQPLLKTLIVCALLASQAGVVHAQSESSIRKKIAGLKVLASQFSISTRMKVTNLQRLMEAEAAAMALLDSTVDQMQLFREFGPISGQGPQVCDAANQRTDISKIGAQRDQYNLGNTFRAGQLPLPVDGYVVKSMELQLRDYCSADMHNAGICRSRMDGMKSASSDFTELALAEQLTSKQYSAAQAFISNMLPGPTSVNLVSEAQCKTPACAQAKQSAAELNAMSSMVAHSYGSYFGNKIGAKTYAPITSGAANAQN